MSKPRLLLASSAPAAGNAPDGFSHRLAALEAALSSSWSVARVSIGDQTNGGGELDLSRDLHFEGPTMGARIRRLTSRLPSSVVRVTGWSEIIYRSDPQLVLIHMPDIAHLAFDVPPEIPVVTLFEENLFLHRESAVYRTSPTMLRRSMLRLDRARVKRQLQRLDARAALFAVISSDEAADLAAFAGVRDVRVVPHGIPRRWASGGRFGNAAPIDVLVVGRFDHARNVELLRKIVGKSHEISPELKWSLVGIGAAQLRFAGRANVELIDSVPDVRPFYRSARLAVVVPSFGSGVKTTLLQAWAAGVPVVSNSLGVAGTAARRDQEAVLGERPSELALAVRRLYSDESLRAKLVRNGRRLVARDHDVEQIMNSFSADIWALARTRSMRR